MLLSKGVPSPSKFSKLLSLVHSLSDYVIATNMSTSDMVPDEVSNNLWIKKRAGHVLLLGE
jgi:hypothetical protein